jgi:hypothetical protein
MRAKRRKKSIWRSDALIPIIIILTVLCFASFVGPKLMPAASQGRNSAIGPMAAAAEKWVEECSTP